MAKLTYKQAYDKIIEAYFKDEIEPMEVSFCFCGTLCNNKSDWFVSFTRSSGRYEYNNFGEYTGLEYYAMEEALLKALRGEDKITYESDLFAGMSAALDVLKQIHIERGEVIDDVPVFSKRNLATT